MSLTHGVSLAAGVLGNDGFGLGLDEQARNKLSAFSSIVLKSTLLYGNGGTPPPNRTSKARYDVEGITLNNVKLRSNGVSSMQDALLHLENVKANIVPSVPIQRVHNTTHNQSGVLNRVWQLPTVDTVELNLKYLEDLDYSRPSIDFTKIKDSLADRLKELNEASGTETRNVWLKLPADRYVAMQLASYHKHLYNHITGFVVSNSLEGKIYNNTVEKRSNVKNSTVGISSSAMKYANCHTIELMRGNGTYKPIIGCGGISSEDDIEDYKMAGASGVQIGALYLHYPDTAISLAHAYN